MSQLIVGKPGATGSLAGFDVIERAGVALEGGRILAAGRMETLNDGLLKHADEVIDATGRLVTPGLVDCHTHAVFAGDRAAEFHTRVRGADYSEILASGGGIHSTVRQTRQATPDRLVAEARPRLETMLRHGTTTAEIKSGYGLTEADELKILRAVRALRDDRTSPGAGAIPALVSTFLGAHAVPEEFSIHRNRYVDLIISMLPKIKEEGLADFCDVFCDAGAFTNEETAKVLQAAKAAGLGLKVHADELSHTGFVPVAVELGAASADHLVHTSAEDIAAMARGSTVAVLLPNTTFSLMKGRYAPARAFLDAGVPVAIATDFNPGTSFCPNLQQILMLAITQLKMTPLEALVAATYNGARALRLDDRGVIAPGYRADLLVWNIPSIGYFGYYQGVNSVDTVIQNGELVWRH